MGGTRTPAGGANSNKSDMIDISKQIRVSRDVHKRLKTEAAKRGISLANLANQLLNDSLEETTTSESAPKEA